MTFKRQRGFTIIELMVTLAVAGVLISLAVPSMRNLLIGNRLTAQTNGLVAALQYARSEAIKRSVPVTIAPATGTDMTVTDWGAQGWQVFVDFNGNGSVDTTAPADIVLRREAAVPTNSDYASVTVSASPLTFRTNGGTNTLLTAKVCNSQYKGASNERQVQVSLVGAVQSIETSNPTCS